MHATSTDSETGDSGVTRIGHWVAGRAVPGDSGRTAPVYDPAAGVQTSEVALASPAEVDAVVALRRRGVARLAFLVSDAAAPASSSGCGSCSTPAVTSSPPP